MEFINTAIRSFELVGYADIIDIALVAIILYWVFSLVRGTNGGPVLRGVIVILLATQISSWLGLYSLNYVLSNVLQLGFIALVIIFQPELRRGLEQVGKSRFPSLFNFADITETELSRVIKQVVEACSDLAVDKIGALIVFERGGGLTGIKNTGAKLNAEVTAQLLESIFFPNAPLHDGAVIISGKNIAAAACVLPLSNNQNLSRDLGTRHRAAVGVSETGNCVAVVVSEQTGTVSVAINGMLKRHLTPETLEKLLVNELMPTEPGGKKRIFSQWRNRQK